MELGEKGFTRVSLAKLNSPEYAGKTDDVVLAEIYNKEYSDKLDFKTFSEKMNAPLGYQEANRNANTNTTTKQYNESYTGAYIQQIAPEFVESEKEKDKIKFTEAFLDSDFSRAIPFTGDVKDIYKYGKIYDISQKLAYDEEISEDDQKYFDDYIKEEYSKQVRGSTVGGVIGGAIPSTIGFGGEFAITGGLYSIGKTSLRSGAKKVSTEVLKASVEKAVKTSLAKKAGRVAATGAIYTAIQSPIKIPAIYQARAVNQGLMITDKGQVLFEEMQETPSKALMKSFGSSWVENTSELTGSAFIAPITSKLYKPFSKLVRGHTGLKITDAIKKFGYDGLLEELGEERIAALMSTALDINNQGYSWDSFLEQNKMTMDDLLAEVGIISVQAGFSRGAGNLMSKLSKNKISQDEIINLVNTSTEAQKDQQLKQLSDIETKSDIDYYEAKKQELKTSAELSGISAEEIDASFQLLDNVHTKYALDMGVSRKAIFDKLQLEGITRERKSIEQEGVEADEILFQKTSPQFTKKFVYTDKEGNVVREVKATAKETMESAKDSVSLFDATEVREESIAPENVFLQKNRGQILFKDGKATITLFEKADKSTLLHETSHFFMRLTETLSTESNLAKRELGTIRNFTGNKGGEFTVAQNEKFARSFEAYLRRGVAPNVEMQNIFDKFKDWLEDIYTNLRELNVNIKPETIEFFDAFLTSEQNKTEEEILNQEIAYQKDLLLNQGLTEEEAQAEVDEQFADRLEAIQTKLSEASGEVRDEEIALAVENKEAYRKQTSGFSRGVTNVGSTSLDYLEYATINASQRVRELSEDIYNRLIKLDFAKDTDKIAYSKKVEPFVQKMLEVKKANRDDYETIAYALNSRSLGTLNTMFQKYNMTEEYAKVTEIFDDLFLQEQEVGIKIGYRENYFPTMIKTQHFNDMMYGLDADIRLDIANKLREGGIEEGTQEAAIFLNNYLRGFIPHNILLSPTNFTKRKTLALNAENFKYYEDPLVTLQNFIGGTTDNIREREFFGKDTAEAQKIRTDIKRKVTQIKDNTTKEASKIKAGEINKLLSQQAILDNQISNVKDETIKEELKTKATFIKDRLDFVKKAHATTIKSIKIKQLNKELADLKALNEVSENVETSVGKLLDETTGLDAKQKQELSSILKSVFTSAQTSKAVKFVNTLGSAYVLVNFKSALKQIQELSNSMYKTSYKSTLLAIMSKNKVTIDEIMRNQVFDKIDDVTKLDTYYSNALKAVGFDQMDTFGKTVFLNATIIEAKKNLQKKEENITNYIDNFFGERAEQVKEDILNDNTTMDVKLFAFSKLADIQPVLKSDRTQLYLDHPSTRWAFSLKSFFLKQLSTIKNDIYNEARQGNIAKASANLIQLQTALWLTGVPVSMIMHMVFDDDDDEYSVQDAMIDNLILNNILNRFNLMSLGARGVADTFSGMIKPAATRPINYFGKDVFDIFSGDFEESRFLQNISLIKNVPEEVKPDFLTKD